MKDKPVSCLKKMYNLPDPSENYAYYRSVVRKQAKKSSNCIPMFGEQCCDHLFVCVRMRVHTRLHVCVPTCVPVFVSLCV